MPEYLEEENIHPTLTMATAVDPDIVEWLKLYNCTSCEELYAKLEQIHKEFKPVSDEHVPVSLQDLKNLSTSENIINVRSCLILYWGVLIKSVLK